MEEYFEEFFKDREEVKKKVSEFHHAEMLKVKRKLAEKIAPQVKDGSLSARAVGRMLNTKAFVTAKEIWTLAKES